MIALQVEPSLAGMRQALIALSIGLGLLYASSPSSAEVADWDKVAAAAKAEGGLVLYTALVGALRQSGYSEPLLQKLGTTNWLNVLERTIG